MWYLYIITNIIDGKIYVGQTVDPKARWSRHKSDAKHNKGNLHLSSSIKIYGVDNFTFDIIAQAKTLEGADSSEIWLISNYNSINPKIGYNKSPGGQGKRPMSTATKKKLSNIMKGRPGTRTGQSVSAETKKKLSDANKGNRYRLGVKVSNKTKKLLSKINTGKKHSKDTLMKMSKSMIGKNAGDKNGMFGKKSPRAKLTLKKAIKIRKEYSNGNISMLKLAIKYGVSERTILNILHNKIYRKNNT